MEHMQRNILDLYGFGRNATKFGGFSRAIVGVNCGVLGDRLRAEQRAARCVAMETIQSDVTARNGDCSTLKKQENTTFK